MSVSAECIEGTWHFSQKELLDRPPETGIAIDSPKPQEIDDFIRADWNYDGFWEVGIHIVDCGIIDPESLAVQNARRRGWSRYSKTAQSRSEDNGAMLPQSLYRGLLNLGADPYGPGIPTVTVGFDFDPENDGIFNYSLQRTRLTDYLTTDYSEFDNLIRSEDDRAVRIATVAKLLGPHIGASLKAPPTNIAPYSVQMMMVTANHLVAKDALRQGIPWIYRNQKQRPPKSELEPDSKNPDEPQEDIPDSLFGVTEFSTIPTGHGSLRLNPYGGFVSPLRRDDDLLNHLNDTAVRDGNTPPFPVPELDQIATELTQKNRDRHIGRQALRVVA